MKVLIACEASGRTRDAFIKWGHDAMSCDLRPTEVPGPHYQGDVRDILDQGWDLMIAHPDCTYLTNSAAWAYKEGPYHQKVKDTTLVGAARQAAREQALLFVRELMSADIPKIAIENPRGVISTRIDASEYGFSHKKATQYVQPHEFGEDASKSTGLWLKGLPELQDTEHVMPRYVMYNGKMCARWANQTDSGQNRLGPSEDRWIIRSATYQGWSDAMAEQWGGFL